MSTFWRVAGLNYIEYSGVCARVLRQALKPEIRAEAVKREESFIKKTIWQEGKPLKAEAKGSG